MTILTVRHLTTYSYASPVRLGEHRMMLRPRDSNDQRLLKASLKIAPRPHRLRWIHDVFDNCVAIAVVLVRTTGRSMSASSLSRPSSCLLRISRGCARAGRYRLDGLMQRFGADAALPDVLMALASCDRRSDFSRPCGARFTDWTVQTFPLVVERVELLLQTVLGRDAGIDGAAQARLGIRGPHDAAAASLRRRPRSCGTALPALKRSHRLVKSSDDRPVCFL